MSDPNDIRDAIVLSEIQSTLKYADEEETAEDLIESILLRIEDLGFSVRSYTELVEREVNAQW